jgi:hypothetical protein
MKKSTMGLRMLLLGVLVISLLASACKKDKDDPDPTPQPQNPKNYAGTTEQDNPVKFSTAEIGGTLFLVSYEISLVYFDTVHQQSYHEDLSSAISSGIVAFNGTSFQLIDGNLSLSGTLGNGDDHLSGTYDWKYDGINSYNGSFNTVKQ